MHTLGRAHNYTSIHPSTVSICPLGHANILLSHATGPSLHACCLVLGCVSVTGLSLDFLIYNVTGFFFYTVYAITSQRTHSELAQLLAAGSLYAYCDRISRPHAWL